MESGTIMAELEKLDSCISVGIPIAPENRIVTDKKGFVIYGIAILILLPFLIYTLMKSDPRLSTHFSDDCGNMCGVNNTFFEGIPCSGKDFSDKPFYNGTGCLSSCEENDLISDGVCISDGTSASIGLLVQFREENRREANRALEKCQRGWWKFLISIIITIGASILALIVLRYKPSWLVWTSIILGIIILSAFSGRLWVLIMSATRASTLLQALAVILTFFTVIILIILCTLFKKIPLVIQLFQEAVKIVTAMPQLILIPILTALVQFIILGIFFTTSFYMLYSLELYEVPNNEIDLRLYRIQVPSNVTNYGYFRSALTHFTMVLNVFMTVWTMRFIGGIQYMIISVTVAKWYFTEKKNCLDSPVLTSTKITIKYHLGTVAFGSFLMTLFAIVKAFLRVIFRNVCCRCLAILYCTSVEVILKFISKNSYIQTAMHGQSFFKSAKSVTKLLLANAKSVVAINCIGEFIVTVMIFVLTVLTTAVSYGLFKCPPDLTSSIPTIICLIVNLFVVCIIFATFQAIIDTLFICFCEDKIMNDGVSRPYFMSKGLMEFVEKSKKFYEDYKE